MSISQFIGNDVERGGYSVGFSYSNSKITVGVIRKDENRIQYEAPRFELPETFDNIDQAEAWLESDQERKETFVSEILQVAARQGF